MSKRVIDLIRTGMNERHRVKLAAAMQAKFNVGITTEWDVCSGNMVSSREDGRPFKSGQWQYMDAWEAGYCAAMEAANEAYNRQ